MGSRGLRVRADPLLDLLAWSCSHVLLSRNAVHTAPEPHVPAPQLTGSLAEGSVELLWLWAVTGKRAQAGVPTSLKSFKGSEPSDRE